MSPDLDSSPFQLGSVRVRVAMIIITAVVIVAVAALVPILQAQTEPSPSPAAYPEYSISQIVPTRAESTGVPRVDATNDPGLVVIDKSHANRFTEEEIQPLVSALSAAGYKVEFLTFAKSLDNALSRADAFVVMDPATQYSQTEVDRIESFVEKGGRLLLLGEPIRSRISLTGFGATLVPQRSHMAPLSTRFGIEFGTGYLFTMRPANRDGNFQNVFAKGRSESRLAQGIDTAVFYTATHVDVAGGTPVLVAAQGTRNVRGDDAAQYPVAVRKGNVLAIGDTTFLERGNYNVKDNDRLVANLVRFLTGGERTRTLLDFPAFVDRNATVRYTSPGLLGAAKQLDSALRRPGSSPTISLSQSSIDTDRTDVLLTTFDHLREQPLPGSGITVTETRVELPNYESQSEGVIVVRKVERMGDVDLIVAADTVERAKLGVELLARGEIDRATISGSTAVIRTATASAPSTPSPASTPTVTAVP